MLAALIKLLVVDVDGVGLKAEMGDLVRDDKTVRSKVALLLLDEFTTVEGREMTIGRVFFGAWTSEGGALFLIFLGATLGRFEDEALVGAAAFPRPKTFCTRDLAEDRNPNLVGFDCGLTMEMLFSATTE